MTFSLNLVFRTKQLKNTKGSLSGDKCKTFRIRIFRILVCCTTKKKKLNEKIYILEKRCSHPVPLCDGNYTCTNDLYVFDTVCYPKCNAGYETELSRYLICNGESWDGTNTILDCEGNVGINIFYSNFFLHICQTWFYKTIISGKLVLL